MHGRLADSEGACDLAYGLADASHAALYLALALVTPASAERSVVRVEDGITVEEDTGAGRALPIMIGTATMNTTRSLTNCPVAMSSGSISARPIRR